MMAVAGGATTAYFVWLRDGKVACEKTTCLSTECDKPQTAIEIVKRNETATVMGSDMWPFWEQVAAAGLQRHLG